MSLEPVDFDSDNFQLAKVLMPFLAVNLCASIFLILQPFAVPVFLAEFCLLAVWSAWGPGEFWKRFGISLAIGTLLFLTQAYVWIIVLAIWQNPRVIVVLLQWLFSAWILAQIPLWGLRYIWQWRITKGPEADLKRFSVNDNMIGITMICFAFGSCRWATVYLVDEYGPFGYEKALSFYGWALFEFYLLIGFTTLATWLTFRLQGLATTIIPLLLFGIFLAVWSAWLWFPEPERWIVSGILWLGTILFSWSVILPLRYAKQKGFRLYRGTIAT